MKRVNDEYGFLQWSGDRWGQYPVDASGETHYEHVAFLVCAAPEVAWYFAEDVGSYQGEVFAVGVYEGRLLLFNDYYGSCSGCGAWGEGDDGGAGPKTLQDVLAHAELFETVGEAADFIEQAWDPSNHYDLTEEVREGIDDTVRRLWEAGLIDG